ncbi:hypothetical protein H5P28_11450 [Ruficoccus amylovorans]|uniref:Uncharacterized protein n=1 Tax=Ruficoccus amylovorans TaxID=1804625 RepID=A0A842HH34_9BACT|nr:RHS repeat-associated core domain-containing protein [Ruficoccus amylovorans]MBC2594874.1 hypothetical protein [Ruficoccus amylovorans]
MKSLLLSVLLCLLSANCFGYYMAQQGRWLSRDPIGEKGGKNLYAMVDNDAVNRLDYLGLFDKSIADNGIVTIKVKNCEIVILDGHGSKKTPHVFTFPEGTCAAGGFLGCYPGTTNDTIPEDNRVPGAPTDKEPRADIKGSKLWSERKKIIEGAEEKAKMICRDPKKCCENIIITVTDTVPNPAWYDIISTPPKEDVVFKYDCEKGKLNRVSGPSDYYNF